METAEVTKNLCGKRLGASAPSGAPKLGMAPKPKQVATKRGLTAFSAHYVPKQSKYQETAPKMADIREQKEEAAVPCSATILDHLGDYSLVMGIDRSV